MRNTAKQHRSIAILTREVGSFRDGLTGLTGDALRFGGMALCQELLDLHDLMTERDPMLALSLRNWITVVQTHAGVV